MDEAKERLRQLIEFFTKPYLEKLKNASSTGNVTGGEKSSFNDEGNIDDDGGTETTGAKTKSESSKPFSPVSRQDMEMLIKTLEVCKNHMSHFNNAERQYLMPLMTLCGHVILTETHQISRTYLSIISEISVYILQFILGVISLYAEEDSNYAELDVAFLNQMSNIQSMSYDSEQFYRYFLKYRLIKFLNFMLLNDEKQNSQLNLEDLIALCQMLVMKPMPDSLRFHDGGGNNDETDMPASSAAKISSGPITIAPSTQSGVKRLRLTTPGPLERNSKEEFFDQLLTPFMFSPENVSGSLPPNFVQPPVSGSGTPTMMRTGEMITSVSPNAGTTKIQSIQQIRSYLISQNQMYFQYIGGATSILNLIHNYTLLRPYIFHLQAIEEGANLRLIRLDAEGCHFDLICDRIAADIELVDSVFSLNRLLEPLSCDRISKMIVIVQACLFACLSLISHANQELVPVMPTESTELTKAEKLTLEITEKSLALYNKVFDIFRQSNRVAGQISQNAHMFTAWLLFSGLQMIMNSKPSASTTAAIKRQQGYSFLCIPLAKHALKLMAYLLDDLHLEFGDQNQILDETDDGPDIQELNFFKRFSFNVPATGGQSSVPTTPASTPAQLSPSSSRTSVPSSGGPPSSSGSMSSAPVSTGSNRTLNATFKYNKFGHYSAWQRIEMIVSSNLNIIHLLFSYLSAGYRRATLLRHSSCKLPLEEHADAGADEYDFSALAKKLIEQQKSGASSDDYEDVNMQHSLLFETFDEQFNQHQQSEDVKRETLELKARLERDIDSHYELVISILDHINYYYICSKIDALRSYFKQMLTDAQLIVLAHVIQDLDLEMDNVQSLSPLSSKTFYRFSSSLMSLMHNLIAMQILSDEQQNSLLAYLGFKPSQDSECLWPLHHGVHSLAILAQIILLRQQKEQEDIKLDLNSTTMQIWRGFVNKLKQAALSFKGETTFFNVECPDFQEDLNVEHAQLMLFLFHNLKLLQRKHVFSLVGLALHEISVNLSANKCSISAAQVLFVGRLLHLFEYMCKNLYDTPGYLFEQINHNLLNSIMNREHQQPPSSGYNKEDLVKVELEKLQKCPESFRKINFFADKQLELNFFNKLLSSYKSLTDIKFNDARLNFYDFILHPRFYYLMDVSITPPKGSTIRNFKPKLDGIACNFMLAGFSSVSYDQFYNSLLNLYQFIGYQYDCDSRGSQDEVASESIGFPQFGLFGLCSLDYTMGTMWRLLNQLPPSLRFLDEIVATVESSMQNDNNFVSIDAARVLNMCIWMPRLENNRMVETWVMDLLSKVGNINNQEMMITDQGKTPPKSTLGIIETHIGDLVKKFSSPEFNFHLLKCIAWQFFRYKHPTGGNQNLGHSKSLLLTHQKQLLPLQHYQFPKFFTLFATDIYIERIISLFNDQFKHSTKSSSAKKSSSPESGTGSVSTPDPELMENLLSLLLGLFDKMQNEISAVILYDDRLTNAGQNDVADMNYLFYRSMVNISGSNVFDLLLIHFATLLVDIIPVTILSKIDQWNRIHIAYERTTLYSEITTSFQKCALFDVPLVDLPPANGSGTKSGNLYHFSALINEKYTVMETPHVTSIDTGDFNITWTKLKQLMFKIFKFSEQIYSKKNVRVEPDQPIDPFINYILSMQLNLLSSSFLSLNHNLTTCQMLEKIFDTKIADSPSESYCANLYPHFIGNAFFILTAFNHPLFDKLPDRDKNWIEKIFKNSSLHFCKLFQKILKKNSGKQAFAEFLCDGTPSTPTSQPDLGGFKSITPVNYSFLSLIEVSSHPMVSSNYAINVMRLIKTLLSQAEKFSDDINLIRLCSELSNALAEHNGRISLLTKWFNSVLFYVVEDEEKSSQNITETYYIDYSSNCDLYLMFKFISYIIKETSRLDEIVLSSVAEAVIANIRTLITDTSIRSNGVFLYFSGLFTALIYLMSAIGNFDDSHPGGEPTGHFKLINEVIEWLHICQEYLSKKETLKNVEDSISQGKGQFMMEACYQMLAYLSDIFNAMEYKFIYLKNKKDTEDGKKSIVGEKESRKQPFQIYIDDDFEYEDDVTAGNESEDEFEEEDEEDLANQLCTFTQTGRDFIHQHWYHCHTCKMLEGVGVCTVCAKVCHKNHDITYSKYGSFFCDCGAKPDRSCKALVKRTPSASESTSKSSTPVVKKRSGNNKSLTGIESKKTFNDKKRMMRISKYWYTSFYATDSRHLKLSDNYKLSKNKFSNSIIVANYDRFGLKYKQFENFSNLWLRFITPISDIVLSLVESFVPVLENFFQNESELGYLSKIRKEFSVLHSKTHHPMPMEKCERMMISLKIWPDTVFENVQISNEQSHSVRHLSLITGAVVRRVSMLAIGGCQLYPNMSQVYPSLLVVAHDKNRISIVDLNQLLDLIYLNPKKKLNPQKIASITFPFAIMNISHNPYNDELVAVSSLKDCHILQLARNGAVTAHYSLSMSFDNNNHIVKTFWFPDSQTELAVVTLDFIKIYDLSNENRDTPVYNFVIPSRKIRDMTYFSCEINGKQKRFILIFSSRGHIYAQELNVDSQCSTSNDVFYVTSILNVTYPESWSQSSQQTSVGFSIYYSHLLQMLFVSYLNGNSFCAPFGINNIHGQQIDQITLLDHFSSPTSPGTAAQESTAASTTGTAANTPAQLPSQPLFQWTEVTSHPGLVFALTMSTNDAVCFMVESNVIKVKELKHKKKIIDLVAVSTTSTSNEVSNDKVTTLVLLCEDGSLRFYHATQNYTGFWLPPNFSNVDDMPLYSALKGGGTGGKSSRSKSDSIDQSSSSKNHRFAVDFFERCTLMNDNNNDNIEFGGSDVLEVYNTQQIKNRLQSANMYIACTKPNGFSITISQTGAFQQVMAGVRVNLGVVDPARAPTAIEVFGRTIPVAINRHRWFDIPFTRSEMKKLVENPTFSIRFAPSGDHNQVTIVDTIRVYGRPRDSIGLNTDEEGAASTSAPGTASAPPPPPPSSRPTVLEVPPGMFSPNYQASSSSQPNNPIQSPLKKIRMMLFAPSLTDDEIISTLYQKYQTVFVLSRMVANSLDVLESLFSFSKSLSETNVEPQSHQAAVLVIPAKELVATIEYKQNCDIALSIASKLLTISLSRRLDKSICMLMAKLLPNRTAYDEHRGEIIFENAIENLKQRAYDDINVFGYNLSLFRETVDEYPRNFIRFIGKYFTQSSDVHASTIHFCSYLTDLFGRLYSQRPANELLSPLTKTGHYCNLESIVECLVFILYSSAYAVLSNTVDSGQHENQQKIIGKTSQLVIQLLCSADPQISHSTKKPLLKIFFSMSTGLHRHLEKPAKTSNSKSKQNVQSFRERRHSGKQHSSSNRVVPALSSQLLQSTSAEPSSSSASLRRQNATRRTRSSGASSSGGQSSWSSIARDSNRSAGGESGRAARSGITTGRITGGSSSAAASLPPGSASGVPASLLERVNEIALDHDFDPYQNLLLNIDSEFPYFQDLMANLRREQDTDEVYESIAGEDDDDEDDDEDEEDDDEDDEDEDVEELDLAAISQPEGNSSSAPPPLYPISPYIEDGNPVVQQPSLDEVLGINDREDEEEDEHDDDDDDDDEFEAMDEDEMMEIAIALSLQDQQREPRAVEEMAEYEEGVDVPEGRNQEPQAAIATLGQIVEELRSRQHLREAVSQVIDEASNAPEPANVVPDAPPAVASSDLALHSESDEDDEELFDDEVKLADTTMESLEADEDLDDEEELNSMETSQILASGLGANLKTSKMISKSNEAIAKRGGHQFGGQSHHLITEGQTATAVTTEKPTTASGAGSKATKDALKSRKRLRRLVASKFCLALLKQCNTAFDSIVKLNGIQTIPFFQLLSFLAEFNYFETDQKEFATIFNTIVKKMFDLLLKCQDEEKPSEIVSPLQRSKKGPTQYRGRIERKPENEVLLLLMRFFSIFLQYFKRFPAISWQTFLAKDLPINESLHALIQSSCPQNSNKGTSVTFEKENVKGASSSSLVASSSSLNSGVTRSPMPIHQSLLLFAAQLIQSNGQVLDYCYVMLHHLLKCYWPKINVIESDSDSDKNRTIDGNAVIYYCKKPINIQPHMNYVPSDLRPFFSVLGDSNPNISGSDGPSSPTANQNGAQDTSGVTVINNISNSSSNPSHSYTMINSLVFANNVFDHYPELLTELSLRLPYQMKKLISFLNGQATANDGNTEEKDKGEVPSPPINVEFGRQWIETLCEYMMLPNITLYLRKHARKLLLNLCGSRDRYRQLRDYYAIKTNLRAVRRIIVMHFFDSATSNLAFKPQDLGLTAEDLDDEDQLDELIRIIIGTFIQNNDKTTMMMSSDQHRLLNLPYDQLIRLVDYLKACLDIASTRIHNWQRLCRQEVRIVPLLFRISFLFGEGISSIILQLLSLSLFMDTKNSSKKSDEHQTHLIPGAEQTKSGDGSKTEAKTQGKHQAYVCFYVWVVLDHQLLSHFIRFFLLESNSSQQRWATHSLLYMFFESLQPPQQEQFLQLFWQLWPNIACYGKRASQFVDLLGYFTLTLSRTQNESLASRLAENERIYAESAIGLLRYQNQVLCKHPNSNIYNSLQPLLELNGYYLETEPCLVCNNPEINFVPVKLSSIKLDSRFTTNTHIVKLIGAHTISKISVKISELKKSKMVKTLCIYYNNRWVQSVVELKNKNTVWHKAKRITLSPSQSEVKIDFALPIVACNLMIEYSNFYETSHSSTETLQCPRCSSIVPANPGVCTNCGENVFQCHKCRAINYDEKDPFLCNSCGFCKYAKFDYVLTARYTASAVEAIENEEDRSKAVQTINTLLEKADRFYKLILSIRPTLENLLLASHDYHNALYPNDSMDIASSSNTASGSGSATAASSSLGGNSSSALYVNRFIHQLATRYSNDCRLHFEELSKIVQKILYTRKELVDYDNRQNDNRHNFEDIKRSLQEHRQDIMKNIQGSSTSLSSTSSSTLVDIPSPTTASTSSTGAKKQAKQALDDNYQGGEAKKKKLSNDDIMRFDFKSGRCYGCATATIEHCIILLKALVCNPRYKAILGSSTLFRELIDYNLRIGTPSFRNKVRSLLCLLIRDDSETTEEFNNLLLEKIGSVLRTKFMTSFEFGSIRHEMSLLAASFENEDNCWEQRLRCVMKLFLLSLQNKSPAVLEVITLPCLRILCGLIKPSLEFNKKHDNQKSTNANQSINAVEQLATVQVPSGLRAFDNVPSQIPSESLAVNVSVDLNQWISGDSKASFAAWQQRNLKMPSRSSIETDPVKLAQMKEYLSRKFFFRWLYLCQSGRIRNLKSECFIVRIATSTWIQEVLFNPTSKALRIACRQLLMALFERLTTKQRILIDLFTSFLDDLCQVGGEIGLEFYDLYRSIVFTEFSASAKSSNIAKNSHWRYYLTLCGLLQHLGQLITAEIDRLKVLEETSLSSDFSQGSALRQLVELMQLFMRDERIRRVHKSSMVGFVLDGYLSLRKLIVQRTKMIDETQAALLELLELITTGTKAETINFMKVCIESVKKCSLQDLRTPVFIFERLCSIIHPEEKAADEFFISLEKDPQQEDFLQGRMLGNPYSSKDSGMGPLMRDIKNKICQECELVSLLEDDSGLELLVNNKIISLDLPVKEVYKKIVCADAQASNQPATPSANSWASGNVHLSFRSGIALIDTSTGSVFPLGSILNAPGSSGSNNAVSAHQTGPTMKIVYRIRGLMGDATEEFIENLSNKESIVKDDENLFELANIMSPSGGLGVMLERLQAINEINNRSRNLLFVLLKLFGYCIRVISNRRTLIQPELNAIKIMLGIVRLFLKNPQAELLTAPSAPGEPSYFEQLLTIMETLLAEASKQEPEVFDHFNRETYGTPKDIQLLINAISSPDSIIFTANVASLNHKILRVVTFLCIGHQEKMTTLINNFRPYFEFDDYDRQNLPVENPDYWYDLFCSLVSAIECNHNGGRLKDRLIEEGFVSMAINYLVRNAPPMKSFVLLNSEEWKEFTSRPALKYVLKMLTGMCRGHEPTQTLITKEGVPIIHALEQVLSDSHMATLAENLMEALKENPSVEAKIEEIRLKTREEKKRIAMAVREKQLGELGMKANDKGQVVADSDLLKKMEGELKEEKGLVCSICREGYAYQPQKVLAIYTFTKRCNVEEFEERKPRKTIGYTTVTHFNIVHVECHMDAVRHARTRDEWQSASLHNANTRCNGLLPLWGPNVYESLFAHALSRHNSYLQEAVSGQRDFVGTNSFLGTVHDLKLLLLRFANERSFSEETGGGGAQSNLYLTPYLMHTALYVMNTTKVTDRERNSFQENFMAQTPAKLFESCHQVDSPYFYSTMVLLLHSHQFWNRNRLYFLRRLILCSVIRKLPADSRNAETLVNTEPTYETIKPALMFFSMINLFYTIMFKTVEIKPDIDWSQALVDYIRHNDQSLLEAADRMLDTFENDILPSVTFGEFCDASDLLRGSDAISDPDQFLKDTLINLSPP